MEDRNNAILSLNIEEVKKYCEKYNIPIPPNERIIEEGMYIAAYKLTNDETIKNKCEKWLKKNNVEI